MKRSRFTGQHIAFALQQAEQGTQVAGGTRKMGSLASRVRTRSRDDRGCHCYKLKLCHH